MKIKLYIFIATLVILAACESQKQTRPEQADEFSLNHDISDEISTTKWRKGKITKDNILDLKETPNGHILAATPNGLLISKDDGISWQEILANDLVSQQINCISTDGKYIYASVGVKGIYRSMDNGISWQHASQGLKKPPFVIRDIQMMEGKLFAGTSNGIYISSDSALSWKESNNGVPIVPIIENQPAHYVNVHSIINGKGKVFAISDRGILSSDLSGEQWKLSEAEQTNPEITSVMLSATDELYAGKFLKDGIYRSTNNGESWENAGLKGFNLQKIHISTNGVLYAGTNKNGIYRSTNKGKTWKELNKGLPKNASINAITSTKSGSVIIGVENNGLYRLAN
jgi:photosystem II stability/assembly factor-like uncharacterized protein